MTEHDPLRGTPSGEPSPADEAPPAGGPASGGAAPDDDEPRSGGPGPGESAPAGGPPPGGATSAGGPGSGGASAAVSPAGPTAGLPADPGGPDGPAGVGERPDERPDDEAQTEIVGALRPEPSPPADEERTTVLGAPAAGGGGAFGGGAFTGGSFGAGNAPPWGAGPPGSAPPPGAGPPGSAPPPPPPPYGPVRRLHRSKERRVVAGVAGGLGEYTGVDPVLFRVLFAVLTVFGGAGILLYLIGWLFLPDGDQQTSAVESVLGRGSGRRGRDVAQVTLAVVAGLILTAVLLHSDGGDFVLLVVVVGGMVLLVRNLDDRRGGRPPAVPEPPPPAAYQPYEPTPYPPYDPTRTAAMPAGPVGTVTAGQPAPYVPPPVKPPKERSILGRLTLSALLVVLGVTAALDAAGAIDPQARHYLALAVGVLGLGLVVGAWRGRARGLIWLGVPLTIALVAVGTAEVSLDGGTGDRQYRPQSIAEVQPDYRVGIGQLQLDLTDLDFTSQSVTTSLSAGIGQVRVIVPREVDVEVVSRAGIGESELFGEQEGGGQARDRTVVDNGPDGEGGGSLRLTLDVGVGRVEVDRATA